MNKNAHIIKNDDGTYTVKARLGTSDPQVTNVSYLDAQMFISRFFEEVDNG